jgi:CMP-2-keto-3-deoxyoctulosonic acid synthetase
MGTGTRSTGTQRVTISTDDIVQVSQSGTWNINSITTLPALPAGSNAIGKLVANSGIDIGDVTLNNALNSGTVDANTIRVVDAGAANAAVTSVTAATAATALKAANASRLGLTIFNNSTSVLYVKFGTTASATDFSIKMAANSYYEVPFGYNGAVTGIWVAADGGAALVTEIS